VIRIPISLRFGGDDFVFIRAGYSLEETIQSGSANGARFFGMENLGPLTVGRTATFLVARGGVQQLPRKLSYLETIYVDGEPSSTYSRNPDRTGFSWIWKASSVAK
jgi:adenine deaminase